MLKGIRQQSLKAQLQILIWIILIPMSLLVIYLMLALHSYGNNYTTIIRQMTEANQYNLSFRNNFDEAIYRIVVSGRTFEENAADARGYAMKGGTLSAGSMNGSAHEDSSIYISGNPYQMVSKLRQDFSALEQNTADSMSRRWSQNLLRNADTLRDRLRDLDANLNEGGHYDENIKILDDDIYVLTDLIQEDIQYYLFYQTARMENVSRLLNQRLIDFILYFTVFLTIVLLVILSLGYGIAEHIISPLRELTKVSGEIANGNFSVRAEENGSSEIRKLSHGINVMSARLDILVRKIRVDERRMRNSELRLLQEQINPHFLYNTLDAIVWMIEGGQNEDAENMIVSLSSFFRSFLSHGREFITVGDEETHIRSYLEIQRARYRDILTYEIRIPEEIRSFQIMKMTLQPLVENALYHGIKNKRGGGRILIYGERDGSLLRFHVRDDGAGMDRKTLDRLRDSLKKPLSDTSGGFGMANVNERIHMHYGPNYGIFIESAPGQGTEVSVVIPAETHHVEETEPESADRERRHMKETKPESSASENHHAEKPMSENAESENGEAMKLTRHEEEADHEQI